MNKWNDIKINSRWAVIKQFSKRTGITDPNLDAFIKGDETNEGAVKLYSGETGISDPVVDYWVGKPRSYPRFYGIDWGVPLWPETQQYNQPERIPPYSVFHMHPIQREFMEDISRRRYTYRPRGRAVMTRVSAWVGTDEKEPDGEEIDLVIMDEAKDIKEPIETVVAEIDTGLSDERVAKALDTVMGNVIDRTFYGGFGGMICHATRERDNYVDGVWKEAPKKLPEPEEKPNEENWENPLYPEWWVLYR